MMAVHWHTDPSSSHRAVRDSGARAPVTTLLRTPPANRGSRHAEPDAVLLARGILHHVGGDWIVAATLAPDFVLSMMSPAPGERLVHLDYDEVAQWLEHTARTILSAADLLAAYEASHAQRGAHLRPGGCTPDEWLGRLAARPAVEPAP